MSESDEKMESLIVHLAHPLEVNHVKKLLAEGHGDRVIAQRLGITRHGARGLIEEARLASAGAKSPAVIIHSGGPLGIYEAARQALAAVTRIDEAMSIHDEMELVKVRAKQIKDRELMADAADIQARADRRVGQLIKEAKAAGQIAEGRPRKDSENCTDSVQFPRLTLDEVGIDRKYSARTQKTASISERAFEAAVAGMRQKIAAGSAKVVIDAGAEAAEAKKAEKQQSRRDTYESRTAAGCTVDDLAALVATGYRAGAIMIDPPWKFLTRGSNGEGRSASQHYDTKEVELVRNLPVRDLAAPDCVLFMWVVDWDSEYAMARHLLTAWGFHHKTKAFNWAKQNSSGEGWHMGQGYWTRANPEDCWLCTKGNPQRINADVRELVVAPVGRHSEKPDAAREAIRRLVPGPYLELYGRPPTALGWTVWGDEISREEFPQTEAAE